MDTLTQVERLIELAIIQRAELKRLVDELPQLREHLNTEIERTFEETEPQIRAELEEFMLRQGQDHTKKLSAELSEKIESLAKTLQESAQAKYSALLAEREQNNDLLAKAEKRIAEAASGLSATVKELVTVELARFPRAGEIDQLRKEFAEPKSLNPRGKWQAGETYNKLDLVTINGDSYVSNIDGNSEKPSRSAANWTLNAARGISGGGGGITSLNDILGNPSTGDIVGSEGNNYVRKTLTAGDGIGITETPTTITIDASAAQQKLTATVKNAESFAITRGQVVYLFGATGGFASVKLASNTSDATSAKTFGVVSDASIAANETGIITCVGVQDKLMLGAYNEGDTLYLGATAGSVTNVKPYAPNHLVYVGIVERANNGNGELYVKVQNGYELDEIHDVQINNPRQAGQTLIYDATNALWKNARLTAGVGVSITNADSSITISADGGVNYQGTWNASTNTPTLTSSVGTKGFYYVVSVAGSTNLNGVTDWKVGDWAIFNGTAWEKVDTTDQVSSVFGRTGAVVGVSTDYSSVGITNTAIGASNPSTGAFTTLSASTSLTSPDLTLGSSGPSVKSTLSARAPRQGLVSDGTAGATVASVPAFGTGAFTVAAWVSPVATASTQYIFSGGSTAFGLRLLNGGTIQTTKMGTADNTASSGTLTAGKTALVVYTRSGTTGTYYINGVAAGTTTDSQDYPVAVTVIGKHGFASQDYWTGSILTPIAENRALSASEVVALYEAGAPAGADYNSPAAGSTDLKPSSGTYAYWFGTGSLSATAATSFTFAAGASSLGVRNISGTITVKAGTRYRVTVVASGLNSNASFSTQLVASTPATSSIANGTTTVEITFSASGSPYFSFFDITSTAGGSISISSIQALGLLLAPDAAQAGGGLVWYDTSGNAANITLPASGVSWNVPTSGYVTSGSSLNLSAGGANQNITLTPSGTGDVRLIGGTNSTLRFFNGATQKGALFFSTTDGALEYNDTLATSVKIFTGAAANSFIVSANGNTMLGTSGVDGGQKLQVSGTARITAADENLSLRGLSTFARGWDIWQTGDTQARLLARGDGRLFWGNGSGTFDAYIERSSANTLTAGTNLAVAGTTASTSTTTGALVVSGGVGVGGNITANNIIAAKPAGGWAQLEAQAPAANTSAAVDFVPAGTVSYSNPTWFVGHRFSAQGPLSFWAYNGSGHENNALSLTTAGNATFAGDITISSAYPKINLSDTNNDSDFSVLNDNGRLAIYDETNAAYRFTVGATGGIKIGSTPEDVGANNLKVQGNLTVSGTSSLFGAASYLDTDSSTPVLAVTGARSTTAAGVFTNQLNIQDTGTLAAGQGGAINFGGNASGGVYRSWGAISGAKTNATATDYAGGLKFWTRVGGGSMREALHLDTALTATFAGNVTVNGTGLNTFKGIVYADRTRFQSYMNAADTSELLHLNNEGTGLFIYANTAGVSKFTVDKNGSTVMAGSLTVNGTTDSSSTTTGALTVAGGVGIAKAAYIGGVLSQGGASLSGTGAAGFKLGVGPQITVYSDQSAANSATGGANAPTYGGGKFAGWSAGGTRGVWAFSSDGNSYVTSGPSGAVVFGSFDVAPHTNTTANFTQYGYWSSSGIHGNAGAGLSVKGTTTNDSAAAGYVGEYVSGTLASGSATALTNSTAKTVTSISLTAGDWDVDGFVGYVPSAATVTVLYGGASTTNNTLGGEATYFQTPTGYSGLSTSIQTVFPSQRVSISSTTTVYLIARADFSAGTMSAFGQIKARRVR